MTDTLHVPAPRLRAGRHAGRLKKAETRCLAVLRLWRGKRRTRRRLAELEPWLLRDIGFSHVDATREVRKSFPWHLSVPWHEDGRRPHDGWR